jgi:hypothetical protein
MSEPMSESGRQCDQPNKLNQPEGSGVLSYESHGPGHRDGRPLWVYLLVAFYLVAMATSPVLPQWLGWSLGTLDVKSAAAVGSCIAIFIACGLAMMIVPAKLTRSHPITRRSIWIPILASGLLAGGLALGGAMAFVEFLEPYWKAANQPATGDAVLAACVGIWIGWAAIFVFMMRARSPEGVGLMLHRCLIAGSVLELLVAVPCHIIVRRRGDCCGGIATGMGICIGTAVALIAFGPSVFLLYNKRWKTIRRKAPKNGG